MRQPPFLKPGDKIGIVAPARKVSREDIQPCMDVMRGWGFEPVEGKNLYGSNNQFSGSDAERAADMQEMLDNPEIKAVLTARGGYGCMRIIDLLDFSAFEKNPKWIAGFSDITVFHSHLLMNLNIQSIHSIMAFNMTSSRFDLKSVESLENILKGHLTTHSYESENSALQREGTGRGLLTGGNLSMIYALCGSNCDIDTKDKILFIEDLDEYLYHIDRMMIHLKRCGKLENLAGLVVGGMNDMRDNEIPFGKSAIEIISEAVADYDYPVCFDFPAGHQLDNHALMMGAMAELKVGKNINLQYIK